MNHKLKVIIVEDEPIARLGLTSYVEEVSFLQLVMACENAIEANNALTEHEPDLMFLDIQMPRLTGIEFLKTLTHSPMVIITTAYPNYALQGFELNVIDYLVKPYPFDRFLKAVNKARNLYDLKQNTGKPDPSLTGHIFVKVDHKLERVDFIDILYIEGMENYIIIHSRLGKHITIMTMKAVEEQLPQMHFLRVHKSYIINKNHVKTIEGNELHIGNDRVPVSRQKKQEILDKLTKG